MQHEKGHQTSDIRQTDGHRDSMKESAKGRFCENVIPLVLPIDEISLRPELSSPARFRFQGGSPERDGAGRTKEILVSNIGYYAF